MVDKKQDPKPADEAGEFTTGLETDADTDASDEADSGAGSDTGDDTDAGDEADTGDDTDAGDEAAVKEASSEEAGDDTSAGDDSEDSGSAEDAAEDGEPSEEVKEKEKTLKEQSEEEPVGDDHPDAIAALKDLGARLDLNKHDRVWRIFFYEKHDDQKLDQIHGLPSLKELWLVHTLVTVEGAEKVRGRLEGVTVHHV